MKGRIKKMTKKDYGRTAIICFLLVGFKGMETIQLGIFLNILIDVLAVVGVVCGIKWWMETVKEKKQDENK